MSGSSDLASDAGGWVIRAGLEGADELALLHGYCERLVQSGVPVRRGQIVVDTIHPVHEGRVFRWWADHSGELVEYGRSNENEGVAQRWRESPFHALDEAGLSQLRVKIGSGEGDRFPVMSELRAEGQTDYLACAHRFSPEAVIGEMDCIYSSWTTDAPDGFCERDLAELHRNLPSLALALKSASLARVARTLVETYLGRNTGRRVLKRGISRGVADRIEAVLWFSDLRGFTTISDSAAPEQIIPFLNDYAEAVISSIHKAGGEVLKLIGDGTLAIFEAEPPAEACRRALHAEKLARSRVEEVNARRAAQGLPFTEPYLGLHIGEVFYGNVGSSDRLDFTVVGPAVNEASRVAAMCRSIERRVLVSSAFAAAASHEDRARLVSVGRYALRGIAAPQELYTLA